jgi:membrane-bound serine protease (ClpP class)
MKARLPNATRPRIVAILLAVASIATVSVPAGSSAPPESANTSKVNLIRIEGAIGPATASYVERAVRHASEAGARCLVVQIDTPGGLLDSTKAIVQSFYGSGVPVVVYVAPTGAHATSAGCIIALAADVAAMAPHTSIGAAHPVELGGMGENKPDSIMTKKLENFTVSYVEAIAAKRRRNVEWAAASVRDSASVTAEKALELKVIDLIAPDVPSLLAHLEGREAGGAVLRTAAAQVVEIPLLARERVLQSLWRPEVMFVLMLIAIYGIIGELSNPGAILPGVAGAIALILAFYMASILPVSTAGLSLLALAVLLFVADLFAPTHGVLTVGGILSFVLGALLLFEDAGPAFRLPLAMVIPAAIVTALFFAFILGAGLRAQRLPARVGREALPGTTGEALTMVGPDTGWVTVDGETWHARSDEPVERGQGVIVTAVDGLILRVKPANTEVP